MATSPVTLEAPAQSIAGKQPVFAQTMLRISDPSKSISFYESVGLNYLCKLAFPEYKFSLYFLAAPDSSSPEPPSEDATRQQVAQYLWSLQCPTLELTHNWPSDDPPEVYVSGNDPPRGYGHLAISGVSAPSGSVPDSNAVPAEVASIVTDPDGYAVKLLGDTSPSGAVYSRAMLRVNNPVKMVRFLELLGMRRMGIVHDNDAGVSHYFVGYYDGEQIDNAQELRASGVPLVHLQHNWRSPEAKLVNGNEKPHRGFGHLGVIVDDIYSVMKQMEELGYGVVRKPSPFLDVGEIAFVKDDDVGYWVELIARSNEAAERPYSASSE